MAILASQTDNHIPADPPWVRERIGARAKVNFQPLLSIGFLAICQCEHCVKSGAADALAKRYPEKAQEPKTKRGGEDLPPIPASLDTEAFQAAWSAWLDFRRKDKRVPVTARAAKMQFKDLEAAGPILAVAAIEQSIANDWQGVFPNKLSKETKLSLTSKQVETFGFSDPRYDESGRYRGVQ
jgi:hypothetical protein